MTAVRSKHSLLAVCQHKPNVYIDLSGWSPKYFPPILVHYANTLIRIKAGPSSDVLVVNRIELCLRAH